MSLRKIVRRWGCAALAGGIAAAFSTASPALALSSGCAALSDSPLTDSFSGTFFSGLAAVDTSSLSFEAGERLVLTTTSSLNALHAHRDQTAGITLLNESGVGTKVTIYTIPTSGPRTVRAAVSFVSTAGMAVTVNLTASISCLPGSETLSPSSKLLTHYVMSQLLPGQFNAVSDIINGRLTGNGGAPQFTSAGGTTMFRASLADLRRWNPQPAKRERPRQYAVATDSELLERWATAGSGPEGREPMPTPLRDPLRRERQHEEIAQTPTQPGRVPGHDDAWNIWVHGQVVSLDVDRSGASFDGHLWSVLGGIDYKAAHYLLLGIAGGYERYDLDTSFNGGRFKGSGYTVGPYLGLQLLPNLVFDIWAGWTGTNYDLTSFGDSGSPKGNRWFVSGNLTGHFYPLQNLRVSPRLSAWYAYERQRSYTSDNGAAVTGQTIELGRIAFGPEVAYRIPLDSSGAVLEPFAWIRGEYDFVSDGAVTIGTSVIRPARWGARAGGGANLAWRSLSLRLGASYDSIGRSGERAWTGEARLQLRF